METLEWTKLASAILPETGKVQYESNKHLFTKVAFDVFQLNTSPIESLWILEDGEDGKQYLVARYDENDAQSLEVKSHWSAFADRECKGITLLYKNTPIQRFASEEFGFTKEDAHVFQKTLIQTLNSDKSFVAKLLKSQSQDKQELLLKQFPELA
jgi:hypothetical protein